MKKNINIVLPIKDFNWGGGLDLLRVITNSLLVASRGTHFRLSILVPRKRKKKLLRWGASLMETIGTPFPLVPVRNNRLASESFRDFILNIPDEVDAFHHGYSFDSLVACLRELRAEVVLPLAFPPEKQLPVPWIGYIGDFQHKYFPEYFSKKNRGERNQLFSTMLEATRAIIVTSAAVKNDIGMFYPGNNCRIFDLPFSPAPPEQWLGPLDPGIPLKYNLPKRYFIISNQFWIHKSHLTAFEALKSIHGSGRSAADVHIVCTGRTDDTRYPAYFEDLTKKVHRLGIGNRVHFLGHIPKQDQIQIMRRSVAVLQPTQFEGSPGGGSVSDAVAIGIPAIVSDIPVNREIKEKNVIFFKPGDNVDLEKNMRAILDSDSPCPDKEELLRNGLDRQMRMGERLLEAICSILEQSFP